MQRCLWLFRVAVFLERRVAGGGPGGIMGRRSVDILTLERWRALDAVLVLEKLGSYVKADDTFEPLSAHGTLRYHVNVDGRDFELLLRGSKFFDTRLQRGGGGAVDLFMRVLNVDFKGAADLLRTLSV